MARFLTIAALAAADGSAALPDPLRVLARSADPLAAAIAKLDMETHAVVADAALVHNVSLNRTSRKAVEEYMAERLKSGMPSTRPYENAEEAAFKAAGEYKKADRNFEEAKKAAAHDRKKFGDANLTTSEHRELEKLKNASLNADAERSKAKEELEKKVEKAEVESAALLEATRKYARTFEDKVKELGHSARSREASGMQAMGEVVTEGQAAAQAAMKSRELDEKDGEHAVLKAEMWAEGHERVIEKASDRAQDDLERIYEPVKRLVHRTLKAAEKNHTEQHARLLRLAKGETGEEVEASQELVELEKGEDDADFPPEDKKLPPDTPKWAVWAAGLFVAVLSPMMKHCCCCKHGTAAAKNSGLAASALFAAGGFLRYPGYAAAAHQGLQQPLLAEERI